LNGGFELRAVDALETEEHVVQRTIIMIFASVPAMLARHLSTARLAITNPAMRSRGLCGACLVRSRVMMGVFMMRR